MALSAFKDEARSIKISVLSMMHLMFLKSLKDGGNVKAVISLNGNGFKYANSFSISMIHVVNTRDR